MVNTDTRELQRHRRNAGDQSARIDWPQSQDDGSVTVVAVSYNTFSITLQLIFSLYRILDETPKHIVVVDNGSADGSAEFLTELHHLGLITFVRNISSNQHGPGLNRGMDAARQLNPHASLVWVVDSDVFIARHDALSAATAFVAETGCSMVGPRDASAPTVGLPDGYAHVSCLLFDPRRVWRAATSVFRDHGAPAQTMQEDLRVEGEPVGFFPYYEEGYAVHLGRATLMQIAATAETNNPLYEWAMTHNVHHYAGYADGPELHRRIGLALQREVAELTPAGFVAACTRPARIDLQADP